SSWNGGQDSSGLQGRTGIVGRYPHAGAHPIPRSSRAWNGAAGNGAAGPGMSDLGPGGWPSRPGLSDPGYVYRGDPEPAPDPRQPRYREESESDGQLPWPEAAGSLYPHAGPGGMPYAPGGYPVQRGADPSGAIVLPGLGSMRYPGGVGGFPFWR
ncbi:MAG: hypothetical protein ACPGUC_07490, partial [Gammaproteobacteria bacterium]